MINILYSVVQYDIHKLVAILIIQMHDSHRHPAAAERIRLRL